MIEDIERINQFNVEILSKYIELKMDNIEMTNISNDRLKELEEKNMYINDDFKSKVKYFLSTGAKLAISLCGFGNFVDFESYKSYAEKNKYKNLNSEMYSLHKTIDVLLDVDDKYVKLAKQALDIISKDEKKSELFYDTIVNTKGVKNVLVLFNRAFNNIGCSNLINYEELSYVFNNYVNPDLDYVDYESKKTNRYPHFVADLKQIIQKERDSTLNTGSKEKSR